MAYENQCGSCRHYEFAGDNKKGFCTWYGSYYYPDDNCSHQSTSAPSCYITTMVCGILGFKDDCEPLNILRGFRNNYLQQDVVYQPLLMEYDVIGPMIAENIEKQYCETHDRTPWEQCYNKYLVPTIDCIRQNNYEKAISQYTKMVNVLKDYFGLQDINVNEEDYDFTVGGHGYIKKK